MTKSPKKKARDKICSTFKKSSLNKNKLKKLSKRGKSNSLSPESKENKRSKKLEMSKDVREILFLRLLSVKERLKQKRY